MTSHLPQSAVHVRGTARPHWLVWLVALVILFAGLGASFGKVITSPHWMQDTDLALYVRAAQSIAAGADPYDYKIYSADRDTRFYGVELPKGDPYAYFPGLAEVLCALLPLGETPLRIVWWVLEVLCVGASVSIFLRSFGWRIHWAWITGAVGMLLVGRIVRSDLYHGQANLLILFALTMGLKLLADGRSFAASAVLASAFACKPFLAILVPYFVWRREWRVAFGSVIATAAILAISFLPALFGGRLSIAGWLETSRYYSSPPFAARPDNQSWYGVLLRSFTSEKNPFTIPWLEQPALVWIGMLALALPLVWFALTRIPRTAMPVRTGSQRAQLLLEVGMVYAFAFALGPLTQGDYVIFLLPTFAAVLLTADERWVSGAADRRRWLAVVILWVIGFLPALLPWRLNWGLEGPDSWTPIGNWQVLLTFRIGACFLAAGLALAVALNAVRLSAHGVDRHSESLAL